MQNNTCYQLDSFRIKETEIAMLKSTNDNKIVYKDFANQQKHIVNVLVQIMGTKDSETKDHSIKVAKYGRLLAEELELSHASIEITELAGLVHDIGKIYMPEVILNKPSSLTEQEYQIIKTHPDKGAEILQQIPSFECLLPAIKFHHERFDGKGYPYNLRGNEIPLIARIISIADAFEAMTSNRCYKNKLTIFEALEEIEKHSGAQFDPEIAKVFVDKIRRQTK